MYTHMYVLVSTSDDEGSKVGMIDRLRAREEGKKVRRRERGRWCYLQSVRVHEKEMRLVTYRERERTTQYRASSLLRYALSGEEKFEIITNSYLSYDRLI